MTVDNTASEGDNSLPQITGDITINGQGAVIERNPNAPDFRFFQINTGAKLQLNDLTLRQGQVIGQSDSKKIDGGAIIVKGGMASVKNVLFDSNYAGCGGSVYIDSGNFNAEKSVFMNNNGNS